MLDLLLPQLWYKTVEERLSVSLPSITCVVATYQQCARLRLCLESLACQRDLALAASPEAGKTFQVVVVDDGSTDRTQEVLKDFSRDHPIHVITHAKNMERCVARNHGGEAALGDVVLFLDGDVLVAPGLVALHAAAHERTGRTMARGEHYHLRCTRLLQDPEVGTPFPEFSEKVTAAGFDLEAHRVTREQIRSRFGEVERRAQPGLYPGIAPRRFFAAEMEALATDPRMPAIWMAAAGHNFSVARRDFLEAGGYRSGLQPTEHRELAFRLVERGLPIVPVIGARTYHLSHRLGWRSMEQEDEWERAFYRLHPTLSVKLISICMLTIGGDPDLPAAARIHSLRELSDVILHGRSGVDFDEVRRRHPLLRNRQI